MTVSIAFVDDQPALLSGLQHIFESEGNFRVAGSRNTSGGIVDLATRVGADVLVVEPGVAPDAVEAIRAAAEANPQCRILVFSATASVETAIETLEAGATGFALKSIPVEELFRAARMVSRGEAYISPSIATKVLLGMRNKATGKSGPDVELSRREKQVLQHLLSGQTNREIACASNISEKTVKHHMSVLMQKLNARNRVEVVLAAQAHPSLRGKPSSAHF